MGSKEEHAAMHSKEHARAAKQGYILKGPKADTFSAKHPAYTYTRLCPDPARREPPATKREEDWECPMCNRDSTNDDEMINAVISDYRSDVYDWECTAHWICPVCRHEFDNGKVIERR